MRTFCIWFLSFRIMLSRSLQVVPNVSISFLFIAKQDPIGQICHILITCSHSFGCYEKCRYNHELPALCVCGCMCSFLLGRYLRVASLGHMVTSWLSLLGVAKLFPNMAAPYDIPTSRVGSFHFSICLSSLVAMGPFEYHLPAGWHLMVF